MAQILEGIFGGLLVLSSYIYFNSDLDNKKKIKEFDVDGEEGLSDEWYDKPTYTVSYVITIVILVAIVIFYELRW